MQYTAQNIEVLKGLEPVRQRPGMYIGSTGSRGLHHLLWELIDNAVDEHLAGYGNTIEVTIGSNGYVTVRDEGRGIPVDVHEHEGRPAAELVMTVLHAGGKFGSGGYKNLGGLHGVGISVVNALSEHLILDIDRDGYHYTQEYRKGTPQYDLRQVSRSDVTGTQVSFKPDPTIFESIQWDADLIRLRLREYAYLNAHLTIHFIDERNQDNIYRETFHYDNGIMEYIQYLNKDLTPIHDNIFFAEDVVDGVKVQVSFQYNEGYSETVVSFANGVKTSDGGYHETGFKTAITRVLNSFAKTNNLVKGQINFTGQDVREGFTGIVSVYLENPQFEGQTKGKLGNSFIRGLVETFTAERLSVWLDNHKDDATCIVGKVLQAVEAREAQKKTREVIRKGIGKSGLQGLPGKLADCRSRRPKECELFLVEGDSAGGTAKQARNKETQAILALKGKILNVERSKIDKVLENQEIVSIIRALGCGVGEEFDINKLRYHKIIILVDADVDGSHIATLLLTFFYRYVPELLRNGYIYFAQPPLYRVTKGEERFYLRSDRELEAMIRREKAPDKLVIQRFKGLGEMQSDQLWETTMNPETRQLIRLQIGSEEDAERITTMLMASDVSGRRELIESHNLTLDMLDI